MVTATISMSMASAVHKKNNRLVINDFQSVFLKWALTDSNRRPSACKADALNQLS